MELLLLLLFFILVLPGERRGGGRRLAVRETGQAGGGMEVKLVKAADFNFDGQWIIPGNL